MRTPARKVVPHVDISSPLGGPNKDSEQGDDETEKDVDGEGNGGCPDGVNKLVEKMGEVITTMNAQISTLTRRIEQMDEERRRKDDPDKLANIHQKDISKPTKYGGTGWTQWSKNFSAFLSRRDKRWPKLLEAISERSVGPPLTDDAKIVIGMKVDINKDNLVEEFTLQLYDYLQEFTNGDSLASVIAGGRQGSWETWRYMSEHGKSRQKCFLKDDYRRLLHPKPVELEILMKTIHSWESDLADHTANGGKRIEDDEKVMCLEEMCPVALQEYLSEKAEEEKISTYNQYKTTIAAYVTRKLKSAKPSKGATKSLMTQDGGHDDEDDADAGGPENNAQAWMELERLCHLCGDINALVYGKFDKKDKAQGKGATPFQRPGKGANGNGAAPMEVDHSSKDCYECGQMGHIGANCPVRQTRLAAGASGKSGDKGKGKDGKGKDGKGLKGGGKGKGGWQKGGFPSMSQWSSMYPGPSQQLWRSWWQQAQSTGKVNLFETPQQLSSMQPWAWNAEPEQFQPQTRSTLQALFSGGTAYMLVEKGPKQKVAEAESKSFTHVNKFGILEDEEDDGDDGDVFPELVPSSSPARLLQPSDPESERRAELHPMVDHSMPTKIQENGAYNIFKNIVRGDSGQNGGKAEFEDVYAEGKEGRVAKVETKHDADATERRPANATMRLPKKSEEKIDAILENLVKPPSKNQQKNEARKRWRKRSKGAPGIDDCGDHAMDRMPHFSKMRVSVSEPDVSVDSKMPELENENVEDIVDVVRRDVEVVNGRVKKQALKVLRQVTPSSKLCPLLEQMAAATQKSGKWETISAVVDSGATITAIHPKVGKGYKALESEASKLGVEYEIANGDTIPNLGKKMLAVMTREGTLRGYEAQLAEVSSPLESVRQLLASKHCVLFGLGENEDEHLIINKVSGEVNRLRDDGTNYLHDMLVVPPEEVDQVHAALNSAATFGRQA